MTTEQFDSIIHKLEMIENRLDMIEQGDGSSKPRRSSMNRMLIISMVGMLLLTGAVYYGFQYVFSNLLVF
ncbi:MAG: hypothetical protein O3B95_09140 [Chloroflexi bacterium]|nr:hypothetical protein [Chloroflexota bacterium]